jgi:virginiamycin B lyase
MAVDDKDRIWFVEIGAESANLVGFDTRKGEFLDSSPVSGNIRHMYYHRPAQEVWFGTDAGNIGRAKLP